MQPRRSLPSGPYAPPSFRFFDDGSFAGDHERADFSLSDFVRLACLTRRDSFASPQDFALSIGASEHAHSFSGETLSEWRELNRHEDWPFASARRSVEQAIKDGGRGYGGCEAIHVLRHPATDLEAAQAREKFGELVAGIVTAFGGSRRAN